MNKRHIGLLVGIILVLSGCGNKYETMPIFDTDINGTFSNSINAVSEDGTFTWVREEKYIFAEQKYSHYLFDSVNMETAHECEGTYVINNINEDIEEILIDGNENNPYRFKYKNMIGQYLVVDKIPKEKTFDLVICDTLSTSSDNENKDFDDVIFTKSGKLYISANADNYENEYSIIYEYTCKNDTIYFKDNDNWTILYYIVDGGLFYPDLYKN